MHQPGLQLSQISSRSSIPEKCWNKSNRWRPHCGSKLALIHEHKSSRGVMCCLAQRRMLYVFSAARFHINGMCWKSDLWRLTRRPTRLRPVSMSSRVRPKTNPQLDLHLLDLSQHCRRTWMLPWGGEQSETVFGWVVCVKWDMLMISVIHFTCQWL